MQEKGAANAPTESSGNGAAPSSLAGVAAPAGAAAQAAEAPVPNRVPNLAPTYEQATQPEVGVGAVGTDTALALDANAAVHMLAELK